jgi:hypothetical protein
MGWTVQGLNLRVGDIFHARPCRLWGHPASYTMGSVTLPGVKPPESGVYQLPHLAPRLSMGWTVRLLPLICLQWHDTAWLLPLPVYNSSRCGSADMMCNTKFRGNRTLYELILKPFPSACSGFLHQTTGPVLYTNIMNATSPRRIPTVRS